MIRRPPRSTQSRSSAASDVYKRQAWIHSPSTVITSAEYRLSQASPSLRCNHPIPPPRVNPAMPVDDITPPVTPSPKACVSRSSSAPHHARFGAHGPGPGIDAHALHGRKVELHPVIAGAEAGDVVASGAQRQGQPARFGEGEPGPDVTHAGAPQDDRRPAVDGAVPHLAAVLVRLGTGKENLSPKPRQQPGHGGGLQLRALNHSHARS